MFLYCLQYRKFLYGKKLNFLHNCLIYGKAAPAINTPFLFACQIAVFALVFHPVLAFRALKNEHF